MSEPEFSLDWPHGHQTRDGRKVRIICTDRNDIYPIVALLSDKDGGGESIDCFKSDGRAWTATKRPEDLINAPAPKREFVVWVNVYECAEQLCGHETKESADADAMHGRIACKRVVITEGEFDEEPSR